MILPKLSQDEVDKMQSGIENDLIAFFDILQDEVLNTLEKNKDKSENDIIHEIGLLL